MKKWAFALVLLLLLQILMLAGCTQNGEKMKDPWSENCSNGTTGFAENGEWKCEQPRLCADDGDCKHLEIGLLPPRTGVCENYRCKTYCGSGILRECGS